ncbi:tRNA synthetases class II-domain-containing protein [Annulohypoxylon bovei var. microspora]|nr:tRNA synthetases class II-domain-containing protein [Annulohypoxylon bovei var. microspora]
MARFLSNPLRRNSLKCIRGVQRRPLPRQCLSIFRIGHTRSMQTKDTHDENVREATSRPPDLPFRPKADKYDLDDPWALFKKSCMMLKSEPPPVTTFEIGGEVVVYGYVGRRKDMGANFSFCNFEHKDSKIDIQIVSSWREPGSRQHDAHLSLKSIPTHSPVIMMGTVHETKRIYRDLLIEAKGHKRVELKLTYIRGLNTFPKDIAYSQIPKDTVWSPKSRHLQLRFDPFLRDRLLFRNWVKKSLVSSLESQGFVEIETPILFKSTPEGAREFLVPTRRQGYAYALPQSPQQYKQTLMAGGIVKYYQFAKCFRDEDHRADRQPEFTQLDLEMGFATGRNVMTLISSLVRSLFLKLHERWKIVDIDGVRHPVRIPASESQPSVKSEKEDDLSEGEIKAPALINRFPRPTNKTGELGAIEIIKYEDAMGRYGSDKPDLRIEMPWVSRIYRMGPKGKGLPSNFVSMITSLEDPVVEGCRIRLSDPSQTLKFIKGFMDALPTTTIKLSPDSSPGVFVYNSAKPLNGLSALGHEGVQVLDDMKQSWSECEDGDIIIMHARKEGFTGGSTDFGKLRTAIYWAAVKQGLIPENHGFRPLWVNAFPLFSPTGDDPGQGGTAGICSTHHPFTAPLEGEDFDRLRNNPLRAKADHYDLVINGVEIGGGSRRIHVADIQEYVLRDILKMTDEGIGQFSHLLDALRSGCPPHAGFAFGFDRLISVLLDVPSVRDVIAFPKTNKGEDPLVGSPAKITPEQKKTYHIFEESDKIK